MYVCVCICECVYVCVYVNECVCVCLWRLDPKIRCLPQLHYILVFDAKTLTGTSPFGESSCPISPRRPSYLMSLALWLQMCDSMPNYFIRVLGIKFRSPCLCSNHFTKWAIFPASNHLSPMSDWKLSESLFGNKSLEIKHFSNKWLLNKQWATIYRQLSENMIKDLGHCFLRDV